MYKINSDVAISDFLKARKRHSKGEMVTTESRDKENGPNVDGTMKNTYLLIPMECANTV